MDATAVAAAAIATPSPATTAIGGAPAVVFVDMPSGSCLFAALSRFKAEPNVRVVTGVNLAMLVDFVFHREATPAAAAERAAATGVKAIKVPG